MGEHIHRQCHNVHISGALTVSEQGSLDALRSGQNSQLRVAHAAAPVIVGVQAENNGVAVFQVLVDVLDLSGEYMRHGVLHGGGNVDNRLFLRRRLPYIQDGVADVHGVVHLRSREALRAVLEGEIAVRLIGELL